MLNIKRKRSSNQKGAWCAFLLCLNLSLGFAATPPMMPPTQVMALITNYKFSVCEDARSEIGKPYVWGGTSPVLGFDCSGFSQYIYKEAGIDIPRTALQQYQALAPVRYLEAGDLVFFRIDSRLVSHVGIYLGNGLFIHSPAAGQAIKVDNLYSAYWQRHYAGARRVLTWNYFYNRFTGTDFREIPHLEDADAH